MAMDNPG